MASSTARGRHSRRELRGRGAPLALLALLAAALAAAETPPALEIQFERAGIYELEFADLAAVGLHRPLASDRLALTSTSGPVPIRIADGGDGLFGPGDRIEFVGRSLRDEIPEARDYTRYNVYTLRAGEPTLRAGSPSGDGEPLAALPTVERLRGRLHLEEDLLLLRLPPREDDGRDELWYWAKMVHGGRRPFELTLDLEELDRRPGASVDLRIALRGWSRPVAKPDPEMSDHAVRLLLDGEELAATAWNGPDAHLWEVPALPAERFARGQNRLVLEVPRRGDGSGGDPLIDVVVLDHVRVEYDRRGRIGERQALLRPDAPPGGGRLLLVTDPGAELVAFTASGHRLAPSPVAGGGPPGLAAWRLPVPAGGETLLVARSDRLRSPDRLAVDRPSSLADGNRQADYVIIAHHTPIEAIEPLAELHRSRGLEVLVTDVEDVYDEFGHGVAKPQAIRAFLAHAYHRWRRPAPRYVLLVGDASWDAKNDTVANANYADWTYRPGETARFVKNRSTPYAEGAEENRRGLIPTWNHITEEGHAASDNYFVEVAGDDLLPDMAIGRLPVASPEPVTQIVEKSIAYARAPEPGPWRRRALLVANEERGYQSLSDSLSRWFTLRGFVTDKVYPPPSEGSQAGSTERLLAAFDRGQLLVHFLGHGGRYIWRTGPPDLEDRNDLFTLEDLERLQPSGRLPIVLSMTCYSAPFDHPSADSIGERILRIGDRGAVGVVAASWRNDPQYAWGKALVRELSAPGTSIGEAVSRAKRRVGESIFVRTYNLLGDPGLPVPAPLGRIHLQLAREADDRMRVSGRIVLEGFRGELDIDFLDRAGAIVHQASIDDVSDRFDVAVQLPPPASSVAAVRAYARETGGERDAAGGRLLPEAPSLSAPSPGGR